MTKHTFLVTSKNGKDIYYDPIHSHAATHFEDSTNLKDLVVEILKNKDLIEDNINFDIDMGRIVGTTDVVQTNDSDQVVYALRKNRTEQGLVPFVKSRQGEPCSYVSVSLIKQPGSSYLVSSAWIGEWDDPPFPGEPHANENSKKYWKRHAFVWGSQEIQVGSETQKRPW
jgi:hypothetical protein